MTVLLAYGNNSPIQVRQLAFQIRTWGGRRRGAGRKPNPGRRPVPHRRRERHDRHCSAHLTLRATAGIPSLRDERLFGGVRAALGAASNGSFRVCEFSVQTDHLHLIVEADGTRAFRAGVRGLIVRLAKAINRALGRRGPVWGDRYHVRLLRTPREVRNALVYVLNNFRKHFRAACGLDPCSSARWFEGWRTGPGPDVDASPLPRARTWLGRVGWRRHGPIDVDECPRGGTIVQRIPRVDSA